MFTMARLASPFRGLSVQPVNFSLLRSYASKTQLTAKAGKDSSTKKTSAVATKKSEKKVPKAVKNIIHKLEKEVAPSVAKSFKLTTAGLARHSKTPWVCFVMANREKFTKKGDAPYSIGDSAREVAQKWRGLSEQEKKPFIDEAARDKKRIEQERAKVLSQATAQDYRIENALRKAQGKSRLKNPNAPKKPKNGFMYFASAERARGVTGTITEVAKLTGIMWGRMSESEKLPFEKEAIIDRARYADEMKAYDPDWKPQPKVAV